MPMASKKAGKAINSKKAGNGKKSSILIVEDDKEIIYIYNALLRDKYNLLIAENTSKALSLLKKDGIDLMILDIVLPKESGDVFFARLKRMPKFKKMKVICITVLGDVSDFFQEIDPETICLTKPFNKDELLEAVRKKIG